MVTLSGVPVRREGELLIWGARRWHVDACPIEIKKKLLAALEAETTAPTVAPKPRKRRKQTNESDLSRSISDRSTPSATGKQKHYRR